ncbi:hypothetical protein RhiXN_07111 [Rhizoctonia solani]|uniref:Uncharacterized protein n=1 Tax=Rhizoctonia solani TaxID=456999 RepID=A0A8H8P6D6_9AGAM|nr:uncharacterized protein RhiXN_07111 [Rhizoctonia solani]QRW25162.1 hypothetical protein RhiXN_07111 [Rhizoctonia solani]
MWCTFILITPAPIPVSSTSLDIRYHGNTLKITAHHQTIQTTKTFLSNAERVVQCENTTAYKYAKASTLASAAPCKGPCYHNTDNNNADNNNNDNDNNADDNNNNDNDNDNDNDNKAGGCDNGGCGCSHRGCRKYIYVANKLGKYKRYKMLDCPEGSLKGLDTLMEMDGPRNKALLKDPACNHLYWSCDHVQDKQQGSINTQVYKAYPIMQWYCDNWVVKELTICTLTHQCNHQVQIKKAGRQVAWCNRLKAQHKDNPQAKRVGNACTTKTKGKGKHNWSPIHLASPIKPTRDLQRHITSPTTQLFLRISLMTVILPPLPIQPGPDPDPGTCQTSKCAPRATSNEEFDDKPTPVVKPLSAKQRVEDALALPNHAPKKACTQPVESSKDKSINDPKPLLSKSKGKGVACKQVCQVAKDLSNNGEPAPALEHLVTKQKAKEAQKEQLQRKVQKRLVEDNSKSNPAPAKLQGNKHIQEIYPPVSSTLVSSMPPCPAKVEEPASTEEEATQEYLSPLAPSTPTPAAVPHLGLDSPEASTCKHCTGLDSNKDTPMLKPAQKRAQPSALPAPSPPATTYNKSVDAGKKCKTPHNKPTATQGKRKDMYTQKEQPAKKGLTTATLAGADEEMVGPSAAAESQAAPKGKQGQKAKQELINATDALLGDPTPPAPGRKTQQATRANKC